ncbi:hypothetical protein FRC06_009921, partial [Ceratobasidium sp. 370]
MTQRPTKTQAAGHQAAARSSSHPSSAPPPSRVAPPTRDQAPHTHIAAPVHPAPPDAPTEYPDDENDDDDQPDEDDTQTAEQIQLTKRQRTQLRRFGPVAGPVVKKAEELVFVRMLTECGFPEVTWTSPEADRSEDEGEDGGDDRDESDDDRNPAQWSVFDEWMPGCWDKANSLVRQGKPPVAMLPVHQGWIRLQLAQPRTWLKSYISVTVPHFYGFKHHKTKANAVLSANLINKHDFIFEASADVKSVFRHPCIADAIHSVFFKRKGLAARYLKLFKPMPIATIALTCTIIRHVIGKFRDGEWQKENLNAGLNVPWYRGYVRRLEQMSRDAPNRFNNIRKGLTGLCVGDICDIQEEDSEDNFSFGSDSEGEIWDTGVGWDGLGGRLDPRKLAWYSSN